MSKKRGIVSERKKRTLELIKEKPGITKDELSKELGIFPNQLGAIIGYIRDEIFIQTVHRGSPDETFGNRINTYYLK